MDPGSGLDPRLRNPADATARPMPPLPLPLAPAHNAHQQHPQLAHARSHPTSMSLLSHPGPPPLHSQQQQQHQQQQQQPHQHQQQQGSSQLHLQQAQAHAQAQAVAQLQAQAQGKTLTQVQLQSHNHEHAYQQQPHHQQHQHQQPSYHQQRLPSPPSPYTQRSSSFASQTQNTASTASITPISTGAAGAANNGSDQQQYQRPGSSGPTTPEDTGASGDPGDPNDPKKQRACESCRGLKVRCEPDAANPEGPCKRCAKAGRACVVTQPTRKRQKKTDNRVAELEKKIDALTASLQATRTTGGPTGPAPIAPAAFSGPSSIAASTPPSRLRGASESSSTVGTAPTGSSFGNSPLPVREWSSQMGDRSGAPSQKTPSAAQNVGSYGTMDLDTRGYSPPATATGQKRKLGDPTGLQMAGPAHVPDPQPDVVERGILTMAQADALFTRYTDHMAPHLPGVVFPADMTAAELRETHPILFLSIMAVASSEMLSIQKALTRELMQIFAEKVIIIGQKSLELVQALQVAVVWYWPPEQFEELKFYQLVHVAAVMSIDIGLGRKKHAMAGFRKHMAPSGDNPLMKNAPPDPTTLPARRTWMLSYLLATNTAMALHRPNLLRWTPFMTECVEVLSTSPEAAPTDKYFCHLLWTHKLGEEVNVLLSMDDPTSAPSIADSRTQYAIKGFERELERYIEALPKEEYRASLKLYMNVLNLYMHEIATHTDFAEVSKGDEPKPMTSGDPFREAFPPDKSLTPAHISGISACLAAIDGIFEAFLSLDVPSIRCLPVYNFVRVAYATVVLVKLYFAASSPKSELGKVINAENMKVEQQLENLIDKFRATAADEASRPASKFLIVLVVLRSWFQKQKQKQRLNAAPSAYVAHQTFSGNSPRDTVSPPYHPRQNAGDRYHSPQGPPQSEYSSANTPLQLLSEVATHDSAVVSNSPASRGGSHDIMSSNHNNAWYHNSNNQQQQHQQPQQPSPYMYDTPQPPPATGPEPGGINLGGTGPMPWLDNAFSSDFDYASLGDDFAQSIDFSLQGLVDGSMGMGLESGMRYFMQEQPWIHQLADGMNTQFNSPQGAAGAGGMFQY